jgi:predicted ATP-grasp superfamily ATP-dependent carboligase
MEQSIYEPLAKGDDTIFTPEQRLWISVVMQSAIDAASTNPKIKREVVEWMRSDDFEIVCDMAGMSHIQVRTDINKILGAKSQQDAFRKAMAFRFLVRSYIEDNLGEVDRGKNNGDET